MYFLIPEDLFYLVAMYFVVVPASGELQTE